MIVMKSWGGLLALSVVLVVAWVWSPRPVIRADYAHCISHGWLATFSNRDQAQACDVWNEVQVTRGTRVVVQISEGN